MYPYFISSHDQTRAPVLFDVSGGGGCDVRYSATTKLPKAGGFGMKDRDLPRDLTPTRGNFTKTLAGIERARPRPLGVTVLIEVD